MLVVSLLFLSLSATARANEQAALRVCLLEANPPYSLQREHTGFDLYTAKAVAEAIGRPFTPVWVKNDPHIDEIEESDFPLRRLSRNECDAIFSVPGPDAVKDSPKITIGEPYYGAAFELIGRAGNAPSDLAALGDHPVAVQSQTIANFVLIALLIRISDGEGVA
jgi:hypothetical protein